MRKGWVVAGAVTLVILLYAVAAMMGQARREASAREVDLARFLDRPLGPGEMVVTVTGPDGLPVPRGRVRIAKYGPNGGGSATGGDFRVAERFLLRPTGPGTILRIEFSHPMDLQGRRLPFGGILHVVEDPPDGVLDLRLPPEGCIEGRVLDPAGAPVAGATLRALFPRPGEAEDLLEPGDDQLPPGVETDGEGRFRIGRLGPGSWILEVEVPGNLPGIDRTVVEAGTRDLVLRCGENAPPEITVVDAGGAPLPGVEVMAEEAEGGGTRRQRVHFGIAASSVTDGSGKARLRGLDRDRSYHLSLRPSNPGAWAGAVRNGWSPRDERIALDPMRQLTVRVVDPEGRPLPVGQITWRRAVGDPGGNGTGRETFHAPAVPLLVWGWIEGSIDLRPEGREVAVGAEDREVRLVLDPGLEMAVRVANPPPGEEPETVLHSGLRGGSFLAPVRKGASFLWRGLGRGEKCAVLFRAPKAGLCALLTDLEGGGPERSVTLLPGITLAGRVRWPEGSDGGAVWLERDGTGLAVAVESKKDGSFTAGALPPGEWTAVAATGVGGGRVEARAPAREGEAAVIRFP